MNPPETIHLVWCPACGRNDRFTALRETLPHNTPQGRRCEGTPVRLFYSRPADKPGTWAS